MSSLRMRGHGLAFLVLTPSRVAPAPTASAPKTLGGMPPATANELLDAWQSTQEEMNGTVEVGLCCADTFRAGIDDDASRTRAARRRSQRCPGIAGGTLSLALGRSKLNTLSTKVG